MRDTTRQAFAAAVADGHELYWWHAAILEELERVEGYTLPDGQARPAYSATGIAGNLRGQSVTDTRTYIAQLVTAGLVAECAPRWDFPDVWVELVSTDAEESSA